MPSPHIQVDPTTREDSDNPGGTLHIKALDGVRGTAILLVLFHHLFWANNNTGNHIADFISKLRGTTYVGVNLFFALSGFLITRILLETLHEKNFFKIFYSRRALRIFPLYYGFLFLLLFLTPVFHFQWSGWQYFYLTYTSNLAFWYHHPLNLAFFNINHFWSLNVEEQFYLLWPFVVYRVRDLNRLLKITLSTCAVIFLIRVTLILLRSRFPDPYLTYSPTFSCADNLLYGCAVAILLRTPSWKRTIELAPRVFAACACIVLILFVSQHGLEFENPIISTIGFSTFGIMAASLIAMTLKRNTRSEKLFSTPALRFLGKYSYGIYVYHYSVDGFLRDWLRHAFFTVTHSKLVGVVATAIISGLVSLLIAIASYHLFEVHFLKLKRFFPYASQKEAYLKTT